ncbi:MAG: class I mannose-6-phosphate isomerase [Clostridia bacterium]|nr:class I mannose-6-phosphate isomerase [Deltaproteobacteria bacterium]
MIRFVPEYHVAAWGGRRLAQELGRKIPDGPIGESWELVDIEGHSTLAMNGTALRTLWQSGAIGGSAQGSFPFLLKWLDPTEWLSVQVHPNEDGCRSMGRGDPKSEGWYIAKADEGAKLLVGHYPGLDLKTLEQSASSGTIVKWLYEVMPRAGDMLMVEAGTLHAIGPGLLVLEVQQPSTTTYRLHDWGRVGLDGKPRELHLEEALQSVCISRPGAPAITKSKVVGPCFTMESVRDAKSPVDPNALRVFAATGKVLLVHQRGAEDLNLGDIIVGEPADGAVHIDGHCVVLSAP